MSTSYDQIAKEYQASKLLPWRTHIERYTLLKLTRGVAGMQVLDLACGEGYYTRLLRRLGAGPVTGVDLSQGMIDLARAQELADPLGVRYEAADARAIDPQPTNDLVFAAYLLNYAKDYDELLAMCHAIVRSMKPGGRFVTVEYTPDFSAIDRLELRLLARDAAQPLRRSPRTVVVVSARDDLGPETARLLTEPLVDVGHLRG